MNYLRWAIKNNTLLNLEKQCSISDLNNLIFGVAKNETYIS
jgi:hypothetical protein